MPRRHCHGLSCRTAADGSALHAFDDAEAERVAAEIAATGVTEVAVCLLFSFADGSDERRFGEVAARHGLRATLSCDVLPEFREYERASTAAAAAHLRPPVEKYLSALVGELPRHVEGVRVLHGGGGTLRPERAAAQAARLTLSGPAGGVAAAAWVAARHGIADAVSYDMGGTSTDVALIRDGACGQSIGHDVGGVPVALPMFDIHTIGAGGGSVAFRDAGGALRVGPRSAGAIPGPACYHKGGALPTVTDADVVLDRLPGDTTLGDHLPIHPPLARKVLAQLAAEFGQTPEETAAAVVEVAEANMARAVRAVTARRGIDPRPLALICFGGAGGLHACPVAEQLDMRRVVVPPMSGVLSALGMLVAPPMAEAGRTVLHLAGVLDDDRLHAEAGSLNAQILDELPDAARVEVWADCRFAGQSHEVPVKLASSSLAAARAAFAAAYAERYSRVPEGRDVEIVTLRVRRYGTPPEIELPPLDSAPQTDEVEMIDMPTTRHDREGVRPAQPASGSSNAIPEIAGCAGRTSSRSCLATRVPRLNRAAVLREPVAGPAVVADGEATVWVPAGWAATAAGDGTLFLDREGW